METGDELPKFMTTKKIAEMLNCSPGTVLAYIGRAEFSHLGISKLRQVRLYKGVTPKDIETLRRLMNSRKHRKKKLTACTKQKHVI